MELGNCLGKVQPNARSDDPSDIRGAIIELEHAFVVFVRNANSLILDRDRGVRLVSRHDYSNHPPVRRILGGIGKQVTEYLKQQLRIADDQERLYQDARLDPRPGCQLALQLTHFVHYQPQVHASRLKVELDVLPEHVRMIDELMDEMCHPQNGATHPGRAIRQVVGSEAVLQPDEALRVSIDDRQW